MSKNVKMLIGAVVLLVAIFFLVKKPSKLEPVINEEKQESVSDVSSEAKTPTKNTTSTNTSSEKLSYGDALDLYKNDLLQFNEDCQVSSGNKNFHLNNEIMIDNRSSKANTFMVGDSLVAIPPYDFAFMILREAGPRIGVHCGSQRNVTTISVL